VQLQTDQVHVEDLVQRMQQYQINCKKQIVYPAASNSDALVDSFLNVYPVNVYPIHIDSKGISDSATTHALVGVQHPRLTVVI